MAYIQDNYDLFTEEERKVPQNLPTCSCCKDSIYSRYMWNIDGKFYCEYCMDMCKVENEAMASV